VPPRTGATPARQRDIADANEKPKYNHKNQRLKQHSKCRPAQGQRPRASATSRMPAKAQTRPQSQRLQHHSKSRPAQGATPAPRMPTKTLNSHSGECKHPLHYQSQDPSIYPMIEPKDI
jgi:hypothetical protein